MTTTTPSAGEDYVPVYVHLRGRLSPPGQYGHLGAYTREVTVTEITALNTTGAMISSGLTTGGRSSRRMAAPLGQSLPSA